MDRIRGRGGGQDEGGEEVDRIRGRGGRIRGRGGGQD